MNSRKTLPIPQFHLRTSLVVSFVVQIVAAVGLTGWLAFANSQKSVNDMLTQISDEVTARVQEHIKIFADIPHQFLQINLAAIRAGNLDLTDYSTMMRYFWEQTQISEVVPYVYFANEQGDFVGVWQESDALTSFRLKNPSTGSRRQIYQLDERGKPMELISNQVYDPRPRPWYQAAVTAGGPTWSPIYVFESPPSLGMTHVIPIYAQSESLLGVLAADLTLSDISHFLRQLKVGDSGQIFIMERSGEIVASSTGESPFLKTERTEKRLAALHSSNPLIQKAAQHLLSRFGSFEKIDTNERLTFEIESQPQFLQVTTLQDDRGLDWLLVVVIPKANFTAQIDANTRNTIILCGVALVMATLSGILTSSWITAPLVRVSQASNRLAQGELAQQVESSVIKEIDTLANSFNQMAAQLKESFDALRQSEATNRAIVNTIPDLMIRVRGDGSNLALIGSHHDQSLYEVKGLKPGTTLEESWPADLVKKQMHYIEQALATGTLQVYEQQILLNGQLRSEEVRIMVLGEDEVLLMMHDISARKQAELLLADYNKLLEAKVAERTQELHQALEQLQTTQKQLVESDKMASLGGLVAGIAHEINTPLGVSVTAASTLAEKTAEFALIYRQGQMKRSQLENFLDLALQSSTMVLRNLEQAAELIQGFKQVAVDRSSESQRTFKLKSYLHDILMALKPKLKQTPHQITIQGDEDLTLHTYPGVLSQILNNLIFNSLIHAFTPEEVGHILITFEHHQQQIILTYADDGRGMATEILGQIFEPFFTTKRGQGGSGLGLHLVYNLVTQKLQGTLSCQSELGKGTQFRLNFPARVIESR